MIPRSERKKTILKTHGEKIRNRGTISSNYRKLHQFLVRYHLRQYLERRVSRFTFYSSLFSLLLTNFIISHFTLIPIDPP